MLSGGSYRRVSSDSKFEESCVNYGYKVTKQMPRLQWHRLVVEDCVLDVWKLA